MARKKKRIPRNMGRIEFIACQDVIDAMRVQGYDNKKNPCRAGQERQGHHGRCISGARGI